MKMTATKPARLVTAGSDMMASWEIWDGTPPLEVQRKNNPLMTRITEGEYRGFYLLEWFW